MYENLDNLESKFKIAEFPLNVAIEVGNYCNLNCIMCANDKITRKKGFIDIKTYKKIIDEIAINNVNTRLWLDFYGEPLLAGYKLFYMIDYAKKKGLTNINMNTNGTLLNEEKAEMLLESGIDFISIDVDGYSKEVFEKIRIGANRDEVYKNIEYILLKKEEMGIKTPIIEVKVLEMKENEDEIEEILNYWHEKKARITLRRLISWGGACLDLRNEGKLPERIACGYAVGICAITWDGNIVTCGLDAHGKEIFGNVKEQSINEIWEKRNKELVEKHINHEFDKLPQICRECTDWMIIGEKHYDENGIELTKNYDASSDMYEK
ncbi:radical SAM protein [Anaerocolumna sp. AGMB13025]|uniref:radical SAM protein n=1 Tax=Anaerocolumna sp. AGMB13025 TaxID=3039116 RepID=UPI00241D066F|nr:radical SAM protein [Anaerocolumna sp. AGMB13025]WFR56787.1 radical SAM protein [Anaerocolumna sp. AGMB13025]